MTNIWMYDFPFYQVCNARPQCIVWQVYQQYRKNSEDTITWFQKFMDKALDTDLQEVFIILGTNADFNKSHIRKMLDFL